LSIEGASSWHVIADIWGHFSLSCRRYCGDFRVFNSKIRLSHVFREFQVNVKHFLKNSKNIYMPGIYDVSIDACKASDVFRNPIITNLLPKAQKVLGKILKDCPYQVCISMVFIK
jgi:hypothetical protein